GLAPPLSQTTNSAASSTNTTAASGATNGPAPPVVADSGAKTNAAASDLRKHPSRLPPGIAAMMGPGSPGPKLPELPPEVTARIDKITESEILAPVMHPQPMALLGIAGDVAFLRSPSGQTGLVKESETLGELKLLRIGTNRVLIEQDGQKKELTIFSGLGGESLM